MNQSSYSFGFSFIHITNELFFILIFRNVVCLCHFITYLSFMLLYKIRFFLFNLVHYYPFIALNLFKFISAATFSFFKRNVDNFVFLF